MAGTIVVVLGSARKQSDTGNLLHLVLENMAYTTLDLLDYKITPYTYENSYPQDDGFLEITAALLQHDIIIWATPVYWYAMSGPLKIFFDRLTDLVTTQKELGRKLKGKSTFVVAVGADPELPAGFIVPFKNTAAYLGMHFRDYFYAATLTLSQPDLIRSQAKPFVANLKVVTEGR